MPWPNVTNPLVKDDLSNNYLWQLPAPISESPGTLVVGLVQLKNPLPTFQEFTVSSQSVSAKPVFRTGFSHAVPRIPIMSKQVLIIR